MCMHVFRWIIGHKGMSVGFDRCLRIIGNAFVGAITLQIYFDWSSVTVCIFRQKVKCHEVD